MLGSHVSIALDTVVFSVPILPNLGRHGKPGLLTIKGQRLGLVDRSDHLVSCPLENDIPIPRFGTCGHGIVIGLGQVPMG